ncbi:hypothetical protein ACFQ0M_47755 [Kitasatospora aburaviensis]
MHQLRYGDIKAATDRIAGHVRPVTLTRVDPGAIRTAHRDPSTTGPSSRARCGWPWSSCSTPVASRPAARRTSSKPTATPAPSPRPG